MMHFRELPEFHRELKRLFKKYKTLEDDLKAFKAVLRAAPTGIGKNFVALHFSSNIKIIKARMACRALRDRSLRIVYAYREQDEIIDFIELYYKGDKANEDRGRIVEYLGKF
ncbi:hypothetical protein COV82_06775 [Candidatus Peregrinibacteria bacterium CG11_big_fil_rev_8_21_14_0_20_46_8]|nr:MAG: hypothetical protein COV82_06775 [Candidatus Peregrinibacteria bacterium CG11_big_fil_rev_8_21_14_0_20_46_8]